MNKSIQTMLLAIMLMAVCSAVVVSGAADAAAPDDTADIVEPTDVVNPAEGTTIGTIGSQTYTDFNQGVEASSEGSPFVLSTDYKIDAIIIDSDTYIDLNGNLLSFVDIDVEDGATLTIENGMLYCTYGDQVNVASIYVDQGCSLYLENVDYYTKSTAIYVRGDAAIADVRDSVIHSEGYSITTNAGSTDNYYVKVNVSDSVIYGDEDRAGTAILMNVPAVTTITDSYIHGYFHGVVIRGGTATITGSEIVNTMDDDSLADYFDNRNWGTGNTINFGALVLGNKSTSAYQYPTNVTIEDTVVTSDGLCADSFPAVYVWANEGNGLGVTFEHKDCTFNGDVIYGNDGNNIIVKTHVSSGTDSPPISVEESTETVTNGDGSTTTTTTTTITENGSVTEVVEESTVKDLETGNKLIVQSTTTTAPSGATTTTNKVSISVGDSSATGTVSVNNSDLVSAIDAISGTEAVVSIEIDDDQTKEFSIGQESMQTASNAGVSLQVSNGVASVTISDRDVDSLSSSGTVTVNVSSMDVSSLNPAQSQAIPAGATGVTLGMTAGNSQISQFRDVVEVSFGYRLPVDASADDVRVYYVDGAGNLALMDTVYDVIRGVVTFYTSHFSTFFVSTVDLIGSEDDSGSDLPFPPIWDDDDDYVPPVVPVQPEDSGDDDTTTIVACAAAAVVAALIAAYLIIDRRQ